MVPKYRYRCTFLKRYSVFSVFVIAYRLKIKLSLSLWIIANKFETPKYSVTVHSKERFKVCLPTIRPNMWLQHLCIRSFVSSMMQARHQDSVTGGGGRNKFWGGTRSYSCEFKRGTGAREIYPNLDQINKVKTKNSNGFSAENRWSQKKRKSSSLELRGIFRPKSEIQTFIPAQKCHEILCQSTKITKIPLTDTNLGLNLHFSSPEPVNFIGAQSSLGGGTIFDWGAQAVIWGGTAPESPRGAGPAMMTIKVENDEIPLSIKECSKRLKPK